MKTIKTETDFDAELGAGGERLILFYSGWCPFCTVFLPAFKKAAAGKPSVFAAACTDDLPELEDRFSVEVVPTVLFFKNGELVKRLDGAPGIGLTEAELAGFTNSCCS